MTAQSACVSLKASSGGGLKVSRKACASLLERFKKYKAPNASRATANTPATIHGNRSRHADFVASLTATLAAVVRSRPEELVGADNASSANPRSAVD